MGSNDNSKHQTGYKSPPEHTRFKTGESGNPNGRPPSTPSTADIYKKVLQEKVSVTHEGKKKKLSRLEIIVRAISKKSVKGDTRAYRLIKSWLGHNGAKDLEPATPSLGRGGVVTFSELEAHYKANGQKIPIEYEYLRN